jgi:hypothetical protein
MASRRLYFFATPEMEALLDRTGVSPSAVVQCVYRFSPELFEWAAKALAENSDFRGVGQGAKRPASVGSEKYHCN